ncbi:6-pyruvoyltetrahydropterin/6-carboxytetrahydropterin synthase [Halorubrum alkaliphilum]|uniref:6-pyruvoyltetrahydropterin/6-carboxytetrahydropterin synthase n=1 Tax=Halorubrum alkaliphilum TaxID=261290 RepID=A0A8T4GF26_9EURY|nr:6-carboxytetrahydropterin synthase [Halorubrum alkaliphilum]MBP1922337.1 6-pyruvoyltetrahydropterin/6-carboxytetrahydropterin synthase [Halorubrum alkaliphilum]
MYSVSVSRACIAQHYLTVPDPGPEGTLHSHRFDIEASFHGPELNEYGYLVDIDAVIAALEAVVGEVRDRTLNDMSAFEGQNPSAERLAKHVGDQLLDRLDPETATELSVRVREDEVAEVVHKRAI